MVAAVPGVASAHGSFIEYTVYPDEVVLQAVYEGGVAMSEAQVIIFAPNDPAKPWGTDKTDVDGWFSFTPDMSIEGEWAIQVRQAGHGAMIHFTVGPEGSDFVVGAEPEPTATPVPEPTATPAPKASDDTKDTDSSKDSADTKGSDSNDAGETKCDCDTKAQEVEKAQELECPTPPAAETEPKTTTEVTEAERAARRTPGANAQSSSSGVQSSGYTQQQRIMMTAAVIWGFVGTGLFFARGRKEKDA